MTFADAIAQNTVFASISEAIQIEVLIRPHSKTIVEPLCVAELCKSADFLLSTGVTYSLSSKPEGKKVLEALITKAQKQVVPLSIVLSSDQTSMVHQDGLSQLRQEVEILKQQVRELQQQPQSSQANTNNFFRT